MNEFSAFLLNQTGKFSNTYLKTDHKRKREREEEEEGKNGREGGRKGKRKKRKGWPHTPTENTK